MKRKQDTSIKTVQDLLGKVLGAQQGGVSFAAVADLEAILNQKGGTLGKQSLKFADA